MTIDEYSVMSLYIEMSLDGATDPIGMGTAFSVQKDNQNFLITNWHNVTGRNPETNKPLSSSGICDPDEMKVWFFTNTIGLWVPKTIKLKNSEGKNLWIEHPLGQQVDVVAIPYESTSDIFVKNLDLETSKLDIVIFPSLSVSIIGYPNGLTSGGKFSIWKTGHIASEMDLNFNGQSVFLIDATTRSGMSGSPVVLRSSGGTQFSTGIKLGKYTKFLGIYSGRIDGNSEIGRVWKPNVIYEILNKTNSEGIQPAKLLNT